MKIEKFKVLLYLKKSGMDKNGKAPIMGRITVNRTMAQFSCKLSCTPSLWNPRASRLEGKSKEAVETNKDIEQLLLSIQKAFDVLVEKRTDFEAKDVKEALQGSVKTQPPFSPSWTSISVNSAPMRASICRRAVSGLTERFARISLSSSGRSIG